MRPGLVINACTRNQRLRDADLVRLMFDLLHPSPSHGPRGDVPETSNTRDVLREERTDGRNTRALVVCYAYTSIRGLIRSCLPPNWHHPLAFTVRQSITGGSRNYRPPVLVHNEVGVDPRANPTEAEPTRR